VGIGAKAPKVLPITPSSLCGEEEDVEEGMAIKGALG
jgi:hypothetical protein